MSLVLTSRGSALQNPAVATGKAAFTLTRALRCSSVLLKLLLAAFGGMH